MSTRSFFIRHALIPFLLLGLALLWAFGFDGEFWLADKIYALQGGSWQWKNTWLLENVIHVGGRNFSVLCFVLLIFAYIVSFKVAFLKAYRLGFSYLLLAVGTSTVVVSILKKITEVDCPWRIARYGGKSLVEVWFRGGGNCFPAGHASGGYAWLALYFFCVVYFPKQRYLGLGIGLGLGLVFGIAQQLRGAHFIGHDLATISICWASAVVFALLKFGIGPLKRVV